MTAENVPTANVSALYTNTTAGTTADPAIMDAAAQDVIRTINKNADYTNSLVTSDTLSPLPPEFKLRQGFINPDFQVWQRGTNFGPNSGYGPDRWENTNNGTGQVSTISRQQFAAGQGVVPTEPRYYLRYQVTTAATGQTFNIIRQKIESVRSFAGQKVILSFYAKADAVRNLSIIPFQNFGTSGTGASDPVQLPTMTADLTSLWTLFTYTIDIPPLTGKTIGFNNDDYLSFEIYFPANTVFTIDLACFQISASDKALPFQPRTFAEELILCQRYYQKSYKYDDAPKTLTPDSGEWRRASDVNYLISPTINLAQRMRVPPTLIFYGYSTATAGTWNVKFSTTEKGVTVGYKSDRIFYAKSALGDFVSGEDYLGHWVADSEL